MRAGDMRPLSGRLRRLEMTPEMRKQRSVKKV
jgi:hypothetical protein